LRSLDLIYGYLEKHLDEKQFLSVARVEVVSRDNPALREFADWFDGQSLGNRIKNFEFLGIPLREGYVLRIAPQLMGGEVAAIP